MAAQVGIRPTDHEEGSTLATGGFPGRGGSGAALRY